MKRWAAIFLMLVLTFSFSFSCYATLVSDNETTEHPDTTEYPDNPSLQPDIVSQAAIVMDAETGQILYEKNADVG